MSGFFQVFPAGPETSLARGRLRGQSFQNGFATEPVFTGVDAAAGDQRLCREHADYLSRCWQIGASD